MAVNYLVRGTQDTVETWSVARMPFEPTGWKLEWRNELKNALRRFDAPGGFLAARYESASSELCDTENVLFYNVGGVFAVSTRSGLRFERSFRTPRSPESLSAAAMHCQTYSAARPGESFAVWTEVSQLATFANVPLPAIGGSTNPALTWLPVRRALLRRARASHQGKSFALRLTLECPRQTSAAAALVKPLFDGVIAACSAHDGSSLEEIIAWLRDRFGIDLSLAREMLGPHEHDPLGTRRLLHRRAGGFQWAPDDDRCVAGELVITRRDQTGFQLTGELIAVEQLPGAGRP